MSLIEKEQSEVQAEAAYPSPSTPSERLDLISPRAIGIAWFVAVMAAVAIQPVGDNPPIPLLIDIVATASVITWFATLSAGAVCSRRTPDLGVVLGGFMLVGHFFCGFEGHLPMTGWIWPTQLMLVGGATALSALAIATRR